MRKKKSDIIQDLIQRGGGSYSRNLGIDLKSLRPGEEFKWLLASILFGTRISEKIAVQTFRVFAREGVASPKTILDRGWDGLVQILDEGGYARYDFKTATKLLDVVQGLQMQYGGDLNRLHEMAEDNADLESRLQSLAKGIGPVTVNIFLRELRGIWEKADPLPGDLGVEAARGIGLLSRNLASKKKIFEELKDLWKTHGLPGMDFTDFEAALVRQGIESRRKKLLETPRWTTKWPWERRGSGS
jgi:hypothetical protein